MINEILKDAEARMSKSLEALEGAFAKIRTGRAHPSLLDTVMVSYYGTPTPIKQVANIGVEEGRTLLVTPWESALSPQIEKAILSSDLGLNPSSTGDLIRVPLPPLTEETRRDMTKLARQEAETAKVSIRNVRRDGNSDLKELLKEKEISEDEERGGQERMQKLTDASVAQIEAKLAEKEQDLMSV